MRTNGGCNCANSTSVEIPLWLLINKLPFYQWSILHNFRSWKQKDVSAIQHGMHWCFKYFCGFVLNVCLFVLDENTHLGLSCIGLCSKQCKISHSMWKLVGWGGGVLPFIINTKLSRFVQIWHEGRYQVRGKCRRNGRRPSSSLENFTQTLVNFFSVYSNQISTPQHMDICV